MLDARGAPPSIGYALTAFMACHASARILLSRVTTVLGPKKALLLYQVLFLVLSTLLWRVRNIVADGAFIAVLGIAIGPYFLFRIVRYQHVASRSNGPFPLMRHVRERPVGAPCPAYSLCGLIRNGRWWTVPFAVGGITSRLGITVVPVVAMVIMSVSLLLTCEQAFWQSLCFPADACFPVALTDRRSVPEATTKQHNAVGRSETMQEKIAV